VVATMHVPELELELSNYFVIIDEINGVPCSCAALLNFGSAISFIKLKIFKLMFRQIEFFMTTFMPLTI